MKNILFFLILLCAGKSLNAQTPQGPLIYEIFGDSVKITNDCDTAELIIENHTQHVLGFLYNKGRGRTEFRRATKLNDSTMLFGGDTLVLRGNTLARNGLSITGGYVQLGGPLTQMVTTISGNGNQMLVMDSLSILDVKSDAKVQRLGVNIDPSSSGTAVFGAKAINSNGPFFRFYNTIGGARFALDLVNDEGRFEMNNNNGIANIRMQSTGTSYFNGGNVLVGTTTENAHRLQVNGTTFSNYFTNIPTTVGNSNSGAMRLRWGGGEGTYLDFYYQGNNNKRGWIGSAADSRPLYINDQLGFSFMNTPFVSVGSEFSDNTRLSVRTAYNSTMDEFSTSHHITADTYVYDLIVKSTGNVLMGSALDHGEKLQVTGNSYFSGGLHTTGTVRFSGITSNNSLTNILVSDANGNLYYRDVSSLAVNDVPHSSLAVNGPLSAQKITITKPGIWPDYVFAAGYKLPSLKDVEHYIQQNNHLPGVPSAAEVEKKGIDVGENQATLLKKIEELTLYIIAQQKEHMELKKEFAELKALIQKDNP